MRADKTIASNADDNTAEESPLPPDQLEEGANIPPAARSTIDPLLPVLPESKPEHLPASATTSSTDAPPHSIPPENETAPPLSPETKSSKLKRSRGPEESESSSSKASKRGRQHSPDNETESSSETGKQESVDTQNEEDEGSEEMDLESNDSR